MHVLLAGLLAGASAASSGPDLAERAVLVDLPVRDVVVFSDRARVTRSGVVRLTGGPQVVRAPDLPGAVLADSVRVTASGSRVVRVETQPVERERLSIDQVDAWIAELEVLGDKVAVADGKLAAVRSELGLLQGLQVAAPMPEKDRVGRTLSPAPDAWRDAHDKLAKRRAGARTAEARLEEELRTLRLQIAAAQREVHKRNLGGFADQKIEVLVIVEGDAGDGTLSVEYAVPGAFWKPAYDLAFDPDRGSVQLAASGLITQATGEDWNDVKLALSTAIPGMGIDLPKLRTWTLGDDREYIPLATARATPRTTRPFLPPQARPRAAELERAADRALLQQRTAVLLAMASGGVPSTGAVYKKESVIDFDDVSIEGDLSAPEGSYVQSRKRSAAPPMAAPAPSFAAPIAASPIEMEEIAYGESARATRGPGAVARARGVRLRAGIAWTRPTFSDPYLPAVSAGGFDAVFEAPLPASVPSEASGLRVPLAVRAYDVTTFYEATPSLGTTAYLKAVVKNGSKMPILAGPANVFVKGTFVGDAALATTGPGGALELPLGADEDIRLTRTVIPSSAKQGFFFGEEDVTTYAVKIEIGNYKKRAVTVRIVDQLPKTNNEKIKVELVATEPKPREAMDGDGLMYWHVDLPSGATKTVTFSYRISRPKDWRLQ